MTVVRYTFDVCLRDGLNKDTYSMGGLIAESILGTDGVCGCELAHKADAEGYSFVNVNDAIKWQRTNRRWLGEKGGASCLKMEEVMDANTDWSSRQNVAKAKPAQSARAIIQMEVEN